MKASERLARRIAGDVLREREVNGHAALPPEAEMAEHYGVGRSTVREALRLLEGWGVVTMKVGRNGGPVVSQPSAGNLGGTLGVLLQFEGVTIEELFEARALLDIWVAGVAAENMTDEELLEFGEAVRGLGVSLDDNEAFFHYNDIYYDVLGASSRNRAIDILLQSLKSVTSQQLVPVGYTREWRELSASLRQKIFRAVASGSPDEARRQMRQYRDAVNEYWGSRHPEVFARVVDVLSIGTNQS